MLKKFAMIVLLLLVILPFQNCSKMDTGRTTSSAPESTKGYLAGNGQPYDGKPDDGTPYIIQASCPDGTLVSSRIYIREKDATGESVAALYRDECKTDAPQILSSEQIQVNPKNKQEIFYNKKTYKVETPAIPLPGVIAWNYQLQGPLRDLPPPSIYIIDMFDNSQSKIADLKAKGHTVICSMSAGAFENWRSDAGEFEAADLGRKIGSTNERWLDTRSLNVRRIMRARLDMAKAKGCHGIDFDSVDGYANTTGFPLNQQTQLEYNQYLAFAAHDRKLILSLNNAPELAPTLSPIFDFAIAEQCFQYGECGKYQSFITRKKPVLVAEYGAYSASQCNEAKANLLSLVYLSRELDGSRYETCD